MSDRALSPDETATLVDYARRKYAEERWPLAPELRAVREAIEKLRATPLPPPAPPREPSLLLWKQRLRGAHVTVGTHGTRQTVGLPGSGLSLHPGATLARPARSSRRRR